MEAPALFPLHPRDAEDYSCDADRVAMITIPRTLWTGSTFSSVKSVASSLHSFFFVFFAKPRKAFHSANTCCGLVLFLLIRPDAMSLRHIAVYKFLMQQGIQSGAEVSIETVRCVHCLGWCCIVPNIC